MDMESYILGAKSGGGGGGGSSNVLKVNASISDDTYVCDKTAREMMSAAQNGLVIISLSVPGETELQICPVVMAYDWNIGQAVYGAGYYFATWGFTFYAESLDDYPVQTAG